MQTHVFTIYSIKAFILLWKHVSVSLEIDACVLYVPWTGHRQFKMLKIISEEFIRLFF